jgi:hypothetical protein
MKDVEDGIWRISLETALGFFFIVEIGTPGYTLTKGSTVQGLAAHIV